MKRTLWVFGLGLALLASSTAWLALATNSEG